MKSAISGVAVAGLTAWVVSATLLVPAAATAGNSTPSRAGTVPATADTEAPSTAVGWGTGDGGWTTTPQTLADVTQVAVGGYTAIALRRDGTVRVWGESSQVPAGLKGVTQVDTSASQQLALLADGTVRSFGRYPAPPPSGLSDVTQIRAAGWDLALRSDGTVVTWDSRGTFAVPSAVHDVVKLADGTEPGAILRDGTVLTWRPKPDRSEPVATVLDQAYGATDASLNDSSATSAALLADGSIVTWGSTYVPRTIPAPKAGESPFVEVATGYNHLLARHADGTVEGFGLSGNGQATVPSYVTGSTSIDADANQSISTADATLLTVSRDKATLPETEGAQVTFTVTRSGVLPAADVAFTPDGMVDATDGAWDGSSFTFAAGQTAASRTWTAHADSTTEGAETIELRLRPKGIERLASDSAPSTVLGSSDQQPDAQVANQYGRWLGVRTYNTTALQQQRSVQVRRARTVKVATRVCKPGAGTGRVNVRTTPGTARVPVVYVLANRDRTRALTSQAGLNLTLGPGGCTVVTVIIKPTSRAVVGSKLTTWVRATWRGDVLTRDSVKATATVK